MPHSRLPRAVADLAISLSVNPSKEGLRGEAPPHPGEPTGVLLGIENDEPLRALVVTASSPADLAFCSPCRGLDVLGTHRPSVLTDVRR